MPRVTGLDRPEVSVTFRLSENAHKMLMEECNNCGCNVSGFIRQAVMQTIADRRALRSSAKQHRELAGQMDIEGTVNA